MSEALSNGVAGVVKSGWKTTEFWTSLLVSVGAVLGAIGGMVAPKWSAVIVACSQGLYAVSRGLAKK